MSELTDLFTFSKSNQTQTLPQKDVELHLIKYLNEICLKYGYQLSEIKIKKVYQSHNTKKRDILQ